MVACAPGNRRETMRKHWQYFKYVIQHKWYTFKAARALGITWLGIVHDWTKGRNHRVFMVGRLIPVETLETITELEESNDNKVD